MERVGILVVIFLLACIDDRFHAEVLVGGWGFVNGPWFLVPDSGSRFCCHPWVFELVF